MWSSNWETAQTLYVQLCRSQVASIPFIIAWIFINELIKVFFFKKNLAIIHSVLSFIYVKAPPSEYSHFLFLFSFSHSLHIPPLYCCCIFWGEKFSFLLCSLIEGGFTTFSMFSLRAFFMCWGDAQKGVLVLSDKENWVLYIFVLIWMSLDESFSETKKKIKTLD